MSLHKLMTNYADYNSWVNQKYADWLSTKPDELLHKEIPSSFSSIIRTLNHIWSTQEYWWGIIGETEDVINKYDATEFDRHEIFGGLSANSAKLAGFIHSLSEEDLIRPIKVESPWFQSNFPRYEYIQHVINHGIYHRGQIVTMARNAGITDAPMTDYNFYNVYRAG